MNEHTHITDYIVAIGLNPTLFSSHPSITYHCFLFPTFFFYENFCLQLYLCYLLIFFFLTKTSHEQWMEWLKLRRSEASLSLLIKLSALAPQRRHKGMKLLDIFSPCTLCHQPFPQLHITARRTVRASESRCRVTNRFVRQRVV